ncbi:helix-turn-helix domain-containing protein [Streptomyces sp. ISL-11]|uniref:helix-turn-helix domain-containing protein n=1 Tax=Streptomyces sp. ISL-11 TaxID=2819174 RepID=UPI001BE8DA68|nr:helix-turn-helix domain-containing protein [Streptomyces sp. ISL-11]MBT2386682.1 helix-turn-helix domain-containing protein [Streptomyces sp. ISL-11]
MATPYDSNRRGRPHSLPTEEKVKIVLSVLSGEESVQQAALRSHVSEQSVWNWRRRFIEAGHMGLCGEVVQKKPEDDAEEQHQLIELKIALGEIYLELFRLRSQSTDAAREKL